jgi:hypothetical protein
MGEDVQVLSFSGPKLATVWAKITVRMMEAMMPLP